MLHEWRFVTNDTLIPFEHYRTALALIRNIDMNDIAFVALRNDE